MRDELEIGCRQAANALKLSDESRPRAGIYAVQLGSTKDVGYHALSADRYIRSSVADKLKCHKRHKSRKKLRDREVA